MFVWYQMNFVGVQIEEMKHTRTGEVGSIWMAKEEAEM